MGGSGGDSAVSHMLPASADHGDDLLTIRLDVVGREGAGSRWTLPVGRSTRQRPGRLGVFGDPGSERHRLYVHDLPSSPSESSGCLPPTRP